MKNNIDNLLKNTFVALLIVLSILSLLIVQDYVAYVGYHEAEAGQITELIVEEISPAWYWNGIYGIIIMAPSINSTWYVEASNAGMDNLNPIVQCLEPGIEHEVYASLVNSANISWNTITNASPEMVDTWLGIPLNHSTSAVNTFTETITVEVGNNTISNVPAVYTYQSTNWSSTVFAHGLLWDGTNIIIVSKVTEGYPTGFNNNPLNYQMFVPVQINTTPIYYIFSDPSDVCPAGEGESVEKGTVYGWVTDNATGVPLENVMVFLGRDYDVTDQYGYYNVSEMAGDYKIVAIKMGYNNYVGNVTVIENNYTNHNISMVQYQEPLTGTGPGVGTGVGPGQTRKTGEGPGIGPGIGPSIGPYLEKPEQMGIDHFVSLDRLYKKIRLGNFFIEHLLIYSFRAEPARVNVDITGNVTEILEIDKTQFVIEQNQYDNVTITVFGSKIGTFTGKIQVSGDFNDSLPVEIIVTDEDKLPVEALLMQLEVLSSRPYAGDKFKFRMNLHNLLVEEKYNVSLHYYIRGVESSTANNTLYLGNDTVELLTATSLIKEVELPEDWEKGDYFLIVEAYYLDLYSQASTVFTIFEPIYMYSVFGIMPLWKLLLILLGLTLLILTVIIVRTRMEAKKRFHAKVEYNLLPKKGPRSIYIGKIAETERDTFFDMDKLTVHTIVAGSTGGGKTISAQVIVEECLMRDVSVVVFDPTAQWTGMLRKCSDEKMMSFYARFHLTKKDSRAFNGNIRAIKNPRERIDLMKYWKPGEIHVFTLSTLDPKDIDIFVANTVREVFHSNLQEFRGLRMLMVYDEVHRLLPKFGGSGEGFIQIERACREFRKWGIGVLLVSQVLADFVGQIKANINTEVQMKTRDEGDLKRIETKYGKAYIQELVKAPVGSGMVQNSAWNRGKPYYVTFRPILHSVKRLGDEELDKYNKYNNMVDDIDYQLEQLEQEGVDIFDLKLELKLARDKIKSGNFNMVDIYLEGLKPRVEKHWQTLGKKPQKREVELISEQELRESLQAAKQSREQFEKASDEGADVKEKKKEGPLGFNQDVAPDKILKLSNGMLVINMKSLYDEIAAMKKEDFEQHVSQEKNDFSDWIRNAIKNIKLADVADQIITKEDYLSFLELAEKGKEKEFKITTPREKPLAKKEQPKVEQPAQERPKQEQPEQAQEKEKPEKAAEEQVQKQTEPAPAVQEAPEKREAEQKEQLQPQTTGQPAAIGQGEQASAGALGFNDDVAPEKFLLLSNGMLVVSLKSLSDEINNMSDDDFAQHVNDQKNEFADWIKDATNNAKLAKIAGEVKTKNEFARLLSLAGQNKEDEFKKEEAIEKQN
ncbi:DUF87 domain-containing protein [Candidatus Woesearchaeota archaeon]|nr:DUF87 domain-containing protein [Candidatus Woesearchaeota archaeon]